MERDYSTDNTLKRNGSSFILYLLFRKSWSEMGYFEESLF
jgi:hypothetical protein